MRRGGGDLRPVDRDDADLHQPRPRAQLEHLTEQARDRLLMPRPEPCDRGVIRRLVGADHPKRDVVTAVTLDPARGAHSDRIRVDEQRNHHRRIVRRPPVAVLAIAAIKRRQIHLRDRLQHTPRQVLLRQPLPQARRQQQLLLTITRDEVLRHPEIVLNPPDSTTVCATPSAKGGSETRKPAPTPSLAIAPDSIRCRA
jgi:hypothetical protein